MTRADKTRAKAAVLTVSDSCFGGRREDVSGPAVARRLEAAGFVVAAVAVVPDEPEEISVALCRAAEQAVLVVTTGGTGIGPRDVTPEATRAVCDRIVEGVAERMRAVGSAATPRAALSRGVCGTRGRTLMLNLPGSPQGAVQSLEAVLEILPHALAVLGGDTEHE